MFEEKTNTCGLWKKSGQYGDYYSGKVRMDTGKEYWVNLYKNISDNEKAPEFKISLKPCETKAPLKAKNEPSPNGFASIEEDIPF